MSVLTYEGIVEQGQIRLNAGVRLPEKTKVYVVIPEMQEPQPAFIYSPRLAHREQALDFRMEVIGE